MRVFEHFSQEARAVVVRAQENARELGHDYIGTEHLLLGMLRQDGVAHDALASLGMSWDSARAEIVQLVGRGQGAPPGQMPLSPRAKNAIQRSRRVADKLGSPQIGTGPLLLAVVNETGSAGMAALGRCGLEIAQIESAIKNAIVRWLSER